MVIQNSKDFVYAQLCNKAMQGELRMGEKLSEERFARELGVSRTPVREAVKQLVNEGVLEQIPRYGTFVRKLSRRDIEELYDLREFFEGYAAYHAAYRISAGQLDELGRLCEEYHTFCRRLRDGEAVEGDFRRAVLNDVAFHLLILHAAGSQRVIKMVGELRLLTNICGRQWAERDKYRNGWHYRTWGAHSQVWRALQRRDGDAARDRVKEHLRAAKAGALRLYDLYGADGENNQEVPEAVRTVIMQMEQVHNSVKG